MSHNTNKPPKITVIVPTFNEEKNLPHVLPKIPPIIDEVLLVDRHSTDNTVAIAKYLYPNIKVIFQDGKGKGNAITCGAKAATGDYFLVLDADGSQATEEIPFYVEKAKEGYDLVKGSRYLPGAGSTDESFFRKILIRIGQIIANKLWNTNFSDICYGMFLIDREKYLSLDIKARGFDIEWELMAKASRKKLTIAEIPAIEKNRLHGKSRLLWFRDGWPIVRTIFREFLRMDSKRHPKNYEYLNQDESGNLSRRFRKMASSDNPRRG